MLELELYDVRKEAIKELWNMPVITWDRKLRRLIRKYVLRQLVEPIDCINWPKGCLLVGLMASGNESEVKKYLDQWIKNKCPMHTVDDCLAGQALLSLYEKTNEEKYLDAARKMMQFLYQHEQDDRGSLPYRPKHKTEYIFADSVGMISPFAIQYGVITGDEAAVTLGIKQITNFMKYGTHYNCALPFHVYAYYSGEKLPEKVIWGRAAGWLMYGIGISMQILQKAGRNEEYDMIAKSAGDMIGAISCQADLEGRFHSEINKKSTPVDTSATAMIHIGLIGAGIDHLQDITFRPYVRYGKVLQAQGECVGIGLYSDIYDSYPWSVGMTLKLLCEYNRRASGQEKKESK